VMIANEVSGLILKEYLIMMKQNEDRKTQE